MTCPGRVPSQAASSPDAIGSHVASVQPRELCVIAEWLVMVELFSGADVMAGKIRGTATDARSVIAYTDARIRFS
ncbi:hypothetical protein [Sorangium sp. So ce1078]|uniref:hypothetical protein n=1 Tax=Sorangium sp. So ce1078 TaxID=3133329 RepID=UPI003F62053F